MPKVCGIEKGEDPNLKQEKKVIKALITTVQSHVSTESKGRCNMKPRIGQGRAGIKRKILQRFLMSQSHGKAEEPQLLPGRKSIIQIAERPILQPAKLLVNLK